MCNILIACDFDGTLADHRYPDIGFEIPNAIATCKRLIEDGHKLILYTMRSDLELTQAVEWCKERGLEFWGVNNNPEQSQWTSSPKVYAHLYIDDAAYGCPLIHQEFGRPYVDWIGVYDYVTALQEEKLKPRKAA